MPREPVLRAATPPFAWARPAGTLATVPRRRRFVTPSSTFWAVGLLIFGVPLARGGVDLPSMMAAAVLGGVVLLLASRRSHQEQMHASEREGDAQVDLPLFAPGLAVAAAVVAFQLVPLPPRAIAWLSPGAADLFRRNLAPIGAYPGIRPLSLDPGATAMELGKELAWTSIGAAACLIASERRKRDLLLKLVALSGSSVVAAVLGAALFAGKAWLEPRFPFVNPNHLAGFLQLGAWIALGFAVRERGPRRIAWLLAFAISGMGIFLTLSRAGIAAFFVGAGAFVGIYMRAGQRRRGDARRLARDAARTGPVSVASEPEGRWYARAGRLVRRVAARSAAVVPVAISLALALAAYLALDRIVSEMRTVSEASTTEAKLGLWPLTTQMIRAFPITGIGRGAFATAFPAYKWEPFQNTFTHVENEFLQLPVDVGVIAGGGLLLLFAFTWFSAARREEISRPVIGALAGSAALVAHNAFDFSLEIPGVAVAFVVVMGVLARDMPTVRVPRWTLRAGAAVATVLALASLAVYRWHDPERDAALVADAKTADQALPLARDVLPWHPADWIPPAVVGGLLASEFRCDEAESWLERAELRNPTAPAPHLGTARCDAIRGRAALAKREYRLAFILGDADALAEAHQVFPAKGELLDIAPDTPAGLMAAGRALLDDPEEAREAYRRAWESFGDPRALSSLAVVTLGLQTETAPAEALRLARRLQEVAPTDPAGYTVAARALEAMQDDDAAVKELELGAARLPGDESILTNLGVHHLEKRRFSRARAAFESIAARDELCVARKKLLIVRALEGQERFGEALNAAMQARDADPTSRAPLIWMARIQAKMGRYDDAIQSILAATQKPGVTPAEYADWIDKLKMARATKTAGDMEKELEGEAAAHGSTSSP